MEVHISWHHSYHSCVAQCVPARMLELSYMDGPARHAFETAKQAVSLMRKGHGLLCQDMKQVIKLEVGDSGFVASKSNQQVLTIVMLEFRR